MNNEIITAKILTYLGTIPFIFSSLFLFFMAGDPFLSALFRAVLIGYGAVILSFLGGIHWGISFAGTHNPVENKQLVLSVAPHCLAGFAC